MAPVLYDGESVQSNCTSREATNADSVSKRRAAARSRICLLTVSLVAATVLLLTAAGYDIARSGTGADESAPGFVLRFSVDPAGPPPDDVDPDWAVMEEYLDEQRRWMDRTREVAVAQVPREEKSRRMQAFPNKAPDPRRAIAAATTIVDAGGHDRLTEAAQFLVEETWFEEDGRVHMAKGARKLLAHVPEMSLQTLRSLHQRVFLPQHGQAGDPVQALFEEVAFDADDPVTRAAARYFLAVELMREANSRLVAAAAGASRGRSTTGHRGSHRTWRRRGGRRVRRP